MVTREQVIDRLIKMSVIIREKEFTAATSETTLHELKAQEAVRAAKVSIRALTAETFIDEKQPAVIDIINSEPPPLKMRAAKNDKERDQAVIIALRTSRQMKRIREKVSEAEAIHEINRIALDEAKAEQQNLRDILRFMTAELNASTAANR